MNPTCVSKGLERDQTKTELNTPFHLLTVKQFCAEYPWPTESAMRSYIYRANELAMAEAFLRVGRRVLIDVNKFFNIVQKGTQNDDRI